MSAVFAQHSELEIGNLQVEMLEASPAGTVAAIFGAILCRTRIILVANPLRGRYVIIH